MVIVRLLLYTPLNNDLYWNSAYSTVNMHLGTAALDHILSTPLYLYPPSVL